MPKKCGNCGGDIDEDEEIVHCKLPYHKDCAPDECVKYGEYV